MAFAYLFYYKKKTLWLTPKKKRLFHKTTAYMCAVTMLIHLFCVDFRFGLGVIALIFTLSSVVIGIVARRTKRKKWKLTLHIGAAAIACASIVIHVLEQAIYSIL